MQIRRKKHPRSFRQTAQYAIPVAAAVVAVTMLFLPHHSSLKHPARLLAVQKPTLQQSTQPAGIGTVQEVEKVFD